MQTRALLRERTAQCEAESAVKRKAEEHINKQDKDLDKWKDKAEAATAAAHGKGRYIESNVKFDQDHMQNLEVGSDVLLLARRGKSNKLLRLLRYTAYA